MDAEHDPQRQADQQCNDHRCKQEGRHVGALLGGTVHVQEVHQVNHDLNDRQGHHDHDRDVLRHAREHHQAERNRRQDHRQDETDHVGLDATVVALGVAVMCVSHLQNPQQIHDGEHADPDHVQEVPEQAQAAHAGLGGTGDTVLVDLVHHHRHPDQTCGHVQAVGTDQREERRQEATALRAEALGDQVMELIDFHRDEAGTEQEGDSQPAQHAALVAFEHLQHGEAEGDTREQQQCGFDRDKVQLENVVTRRAAGKTAGQHRVGGEERRKQDAVGHQVQPETEYGHLARVVVVVVMPMVVTMSMSISVNYMTGH
ncbi:putative Transmembrane protein [Pseudomonas donghuensis]